MEITLDNVSNKAVSFNPEELLRYSRHFNLPQIGLDGQNRLKQARVLCVGAGGLGSPLLMYLAAAGIGAIGIVDDDRVELSNLQRQLLYDVSDIGKTKVEVATIKLQRNNPNLHVIPFDVRIHVNNILPIIDQFDMVVDGTDNFATRYLINDACCHLKKTNVYASVFQFEGQCSVFADGGPCYRCLFPQQPPSQLIPDCAEGGVLGVLPGIMGLLQATEVVKQILGIGESLKGRLLIFDALRMSFNEFKIMTNRECVICQEKMPFGSLSYDNPGSCQLAANGIQEITPSNLHALLQKNPILQLIDVRETYEWESGHLPRARLIPLSLFKEQINTLDPSQPIVVYCKSGRRSSQAAEWLQQSGCQKVLNLRGGILSWAKEIDAAIEIY